MDKAGLVLVGWYHSHPYNQPDPSLQDIETQLHYQLNMKGANATYQPCVGIISCECIFFWVKYKIKDDIFRL